MLAKIVKWKSITSQLGGNQWLYYFEEIGISSTGASASISNPLKSETMIVLSQTSNTTTYGYITAPTPGTVLLPNVDDEIKITWEAGSEIQEEGDASPVSPIGYKLLVGTTAEGFDIFNGIETSNLTHMLDADTLPESGAPVYFTIKTRYPDLNSAERWKQNTHTFGGKNSVLHLAINQAELSSVPHGKVQCNGMREWGYAFPDDFKLEPIGGGQSPFPAPPGESCDGYGWPENNVIVELSNILDANGDTRYIFQQINQHGGACNGGLGYRPITSDRSTLTSHTNRGELTDDEDTFTWTNMGEGIKYRLVITNASGSTVYASALLTTTTQDVTGLPDDGRLLIATIWTLYKEKPGWKRNEYILKAWENPAG